MIMSAPSYVLLQYIAGALRHGGGRATRAGAVAYVTADPDFYPFLTVRDVLEYGVAREGVTRQTTAALIDQVLEATGLSERIACRVDVLSRVEIGRLAFAEALVGEPAVVLVDDGQEFRPRSSNEAAISPIVDPFAGQV